jgi:3-oxoacid CoA-transferase subunit B
VRPDLETTCPSSRTASPRAAQELRDGFYVNLGIGIPTLVANYVPPGSTSPERERHARRRALPAEARSTRPHQRGQADGHELPGASLFLERRLFAMVRGGHIDLTILGAMQVDAQGDLANWMIPGKMVKGMGGAMDLVAGAKRVVVVMEHCNKEGQSKVLRECGLPLTGKRVVHRVISDLAVMDVTSDGLRLVEIAPGISAREVQEKTEARLVVGPDLAEMRFA